VTAFQIFEFARKSARFDRNTETQCGSSEISLFEPAQDSVCGSGCWNGWRRSL